MLELLVLGLYWWFPLAWWARRELREAEEECCDAWVVWALPDSPRAYATALVETLDFLSEARLVLPPAASGVGQFHLLRRRLTMIMRGTTPRALTGAGLLALLGLGALLLPLVPSWAQDNLGGGGKGGGGPGGGQHLNPMLEKMRVEVRQRAAELEALRGQLQQMQLEMEKRARELERAIQFLKEAELVRARQGHADTKPDPKSKPAVGIMMGGAPGHGGLEHRMAEMERKLDMVLHELQALRREAGKAHTAPAGPRPKVPGGPAVPPGPGGRPGVGPGPGGFPGAPGAPGVGPKPGGVREEPAAHFQNPAGPSVQGKILRIDADDRTLVTVSVGHEGGVKVNHTLEVYRLQPRPEYLGRLRILEASPDQAVGRLMPLPGTHSPLKEGDAVSGTIPR
jgi:hypothetical protein